jgi:surface-anchored protein
MSRVILSIMMLPRLTPCWDRPPCLPHKNHAGKIPSHRALPHVESLEDRTVLDAVHILTNQHTDLDVTYSSALGKLQLAENNKSVDPIAYYPADHAILEFLPEAKRPQTADPRFAFTGVAAGQPIWIVPISPRDPLLLQLGVSGERIDSGVLGSYKETDPRINNVIPFPWIRLNVVDVQGPGKFSVWQTDDFGSPTVWVAAGNQNPNLFFTGPGGHVDYNWAFTAPGNYRVDIQASAYLPDMTPVSSDVTTYYFQVDDTAGPGGQAPAPPKPDLTRLPSQLEIGTAAVDTPLQATSKQVTSPIQISPLTPPGGPVFASAVRTFGEEYQQALSALAQYSSTLESTGLGDSIALPDLAGGIFQAKD